MNQECVVKPPKVCDDIASHVDYAQGKYRPGYRAEVQQATSSTGVCDAL
jgi:hypothetical protein